jgi:hypothetical protein
VLGSGQQEVFTLPAVNRRGRTVQCKVTLTSLGTGEEAPGAILMMETA